MTEPAIRHGADAIVVVGDWISEYYFTAGVKGESFQSKVAERRKEWDGAEGHPTSRSHFAAERIGLETGSPH
jgi:hypothetical protein